MLEPEFGAVFDALEVVETATDDLWAGLSVVAGPAAETSDHPCAEGQRAFRMGVLLALGGALEAKRSCLEDGLVFRIESLRQELIGRAVARLDQLHDGQRGNGSRDDQLHHHLRIADVGFFDIEAAGFERAEVLFDGPSHSVKIDDLTRLSERGDLMCGEDPPMHRLTVFWWWRHLANIDDCQLDGFRQVARAPLRSAKLCRRKAYRQFRSPWPASRRGGNVQGEATGFRQVVNQPGQEILSTVRANLDPPIMTGSNQQIDIGRTARKVLEDIAFPVRYLGDAVRFSQCLARPRRAIQPTLRLLIDGRARVAMFQRTLVAVPYLRIDQANDRTGRPINRQSNMQHQSANRPALADRPVAIRPRPPPAQVQFGRVLDHDNVASSHPRRRLAHSLAHHRAGGHRLIAQNTPELHLARSAASQPPHGARAPLKQGLVQQGPPFSRRRSPNRPSPNSIAIATPTNHLGPRNQPHTTMPSTMCAFDSPFRGRNPTRAARVYPSSPSAFLTASSTCDCTAWRGRSLHAAAV